jgi:DNA-binding winged helix-turn-helix (wHTH) protein
MSSSPTPSPLLPGAEPSKSQGAVTGPLALSVARYVRFGPFHLDLEKQELFRDGSRIRMQAKVCEALVILVKNYGDVVTRETLRSHMWPSDMQINYDANVNTTLNKLRQALGDTPEKPRFVETIPRKGYTFIAPVETVEGLPAPGATSANVDASLPATSGAAGNVIPSAQEILAGKGSAGWFTAGVISLVIAAILFGAAITLFAHRGFGY